MDTTTTPSYDALTRTFTRLHHLQHLQAIASWDQAANMPPAGNEARAAALAEMGALLHRMRTDPQLASQLDGAEREPLDEPQRANLREMRRHWRQANALPEALVQRAVLATSRCEHAWRSAAPGQRLGRASAEPARGAGASRARRRSRCRSRRACRATTR